MINRNDFLLFCRGLLAKIICVLFFFLTLFLYYKALWEGCPWDFKTLFGFVLLNPIGS